MKILVAEDDKRISKHLCDVLAQNGMVTVLVEDEESLLNQLQLRENFDLFLLDRMIKDFDVKVLIPNLKKKYVEIPIFILSAISTPNERAELLDLGADEYMGKPFSSQELVARVRALIRRSSGASGRSKEYVSLGATVIDVLKRVVICEGKTLHLPAKEFLLLKLLSEDVGRVYSKQALLDLVWSANIEIETNVVEATINHLRKKLSGIGSEVKIQNQRQVGYWIEI